MLKSWQRLFFVIRSCGAGLVLSADQWLISSDKKYSASWINNIPQPMLMACSTENKTEIHHWRSITIPANSLSPVPCASGPPRVRKPPGPKGTPSKKVKKRNPWSDEESKSDSDLENSEPLIPRETKSQRASGTNGCSNFTYSFSRALDDELHTVTNVWDILLVFLQFITCLYYNNSIIAIIWVAEKSTTMDSKGCF